MAIETTEDIVEELMDKLGVYGAHDQANPQQCELQGRPCRSCAASLLTSRLRDAFEVERKLGRSA